MFLNQIQRESMNRTGIEHESNGNRKRIEMFEYHGDDDINFGLPLTSRIHSFKKLL